MIFTRINNSLLLFFLVFPIFAMAQTDYFWVGGSGNWTEATTHWATTSGGSSFHSAAPTSADDVFFDANSFNAIGQTVTVNKLGDLCKNMDWTGVLNSPTFNVNNKKINIAGSLTLIVDMTLTGNDINLGTVFTSTTTGNTITSGGHDLGRIWFDGIGGEWSLTQDTQVYEVLITTGIFDTQNFNLNTTAGSRGVRLSNPSPSYIEGIRLGTSQLTMVKAWDMRNADVCEASQSTIIITGCCGSSFYGGDFAYNIVRFTDSSISSGFWQIDGNNSFNELDFGSNGKIMGSNTIGALTMEPGFKYEFGAGQTQTINTINGNGSCISPLEMKSTSLGNSATLTIATGTLDFDYLILSDIAATGGATFNATNTINGGGNTGWNITDLVASNRNLFWIGGSGNWADGNHWSESSGGLAYGCIPTATDHVFFDANSFSSAGQTVTVNKEGDLSKNMDWTGVLNTPTFNINGKKINIAGSLTLVVDMTLTGNNINAGTVFTSTTTGNTITSGGHDLGRIWFDGIGGEWSLTQDTQVYEVLITTGIFDTQNFNLNTTAGSRGVKLNNPSPSYIEGIRLGTSQLTMVKAWDMRNADVCEASQSTIIITGCCGSSFYGGDFAYNIVRFTDSSISSGFWQIDGNNSFNELDFGSHGKIMGSNTIGTLTMEPGFKYEFGAGQTQTINTINGNGSCISPLEMKSTSLGNSATLTIATGTLDFDYLILSDIAATGGATFNATNTINGGGNTGWNITDLVASNRNLFWIGGSGNWADGNHWSESSGGPAYGCIPTATDHVFFDANSFSSAGQTVTVNKEGDLSKNMDWTGALNTPTFNINGKKINIAGSLTLIVDMTLTGNNINAGTVFTSTTTGNTITSGGHDLGRIWFDGIGGEWSLTQDTQVYEVLITTGIFDTQNFDMTITAGARGVKLNNPSPSYIEGIRLGTSQLNMAGGQNVTWDMRNADVCDVSQSTIIITGYRAGCCGNYFKGGGFAYNIVRFTKTSIGPGYWQIEDDNSFNELSFGANAKITGSNTIGTLTMEPGFKYEFGASQTQTITNIVAPGSVDNLITMKSLTSNAATEIKLAQELCSNYLSIGDIDLHILSPGIDAGSNGSDLGGNTGNIFFDSLCTFPALDTTAPVITLLGITPYQ